MHHLGAVVRGGEEVRGDVTRGLALLLVALALIGCAAFDQYVTPPHMGPGNPDYPCASGADFVYCGDHTCCMPDHACREDREGGYCEFLGPPDAFGAERARSARVPASGAP